MVASSDANTVDLRQLDVRNVSLVKKGNAGFCKPPRSSSNSVLQACLHTALATDQKYRKRLKTLFRSCLCFYTINLDSIQENKQYHNFQSHFI